MKSVGVKKTKSNDSPQPVRRERAVPPPRYAPGQGIDEASRREGPS